MTLDNFCLLIHKGFGYVLLCIGVANLPLAQKQKRMSHAVFQNVRIIISPFPEVLVLPSSFRPWGPGGADCAHPSPEPAQPPTTPVPPATKNHPLFEAPGVLSLPAERTSALARRQALNLRQRNSRASLTPLVKVLLHALPRASGGWVDGWLEGWMDHMDTRMLACSA